MAVDEYQVEILDQNVGDYELTFKIIIIGDSGVGKSCLALRGIKNLFEPLYSPTIGFEFMAFYTRIDGKIIKMQIWDTCGQEIYKSLISNFYRNSSLAIILYSIDNKESFEHAENWLNDLKSQANPDVRIFLVGNKSDLEDQRKVTKEEGLKFKNDQGLDMFMETSAKTGYNARNVLIEAAKILYADYLKYVEANPQGDKPGQQKKGEELKGKDKVIEGKKKGCC